jgi:hypothetical protein
LFFSVSKANLSEYSEKIEALAARLAASVVHFYFLDLSFRLSCIIYLLMLHRIQRNQNCVVNFYLNLYLVYLSDTLLISLFLLVQPEDEKPVVESREIETSLEKEKAENSISLSLGLRRRSTQVKFWSPFPVFFLPVISNELMYVTG